MKEMEVNHETIHIWCPCFFSRSFTCDGQTNNPQNHPDQETIKNHKEILRRNNWTDWNWTRTSLVKIVTELKRDAQKSKSEDRSKRRLLNDFGSYSKALIIHRLNDLDGCPKCFQCEGKVQFSIDVCVFVRFCAFVFGMGGIKKGRVCP